MPSHSQVSAWFIPSEPPKSTMRPRPESEVIAWRERPLGALEGNRCTQVVPSHSQRSESDGEKPPNNTTRPRNGS